MFCTAFGAAFIVIIVMFGSLMTFFIGGPGGLSMSSVTTKLNRLTIENAKIVKINVELGEEVKALKSEAYDFSFHIHPHKGPVGDMWTGQAKVKP